MTVLHTYTYIGILFAENKKDENNEQKPTDESNNERLQAEKRTSGLLFGL